MRIAAEPYDRTQMLQRHQMLAPLGVDGLQKDLLFDIANRFRAERFFLLGHPLVRGVFQPLAHRLVVNTFFLRPRDDRRVETKVLEHLGIQLFDGPLIGIAARRHMLCNHILDHLMPHVAGDFRQVLRLHDLAALAKNDLALLVHHVVELQQLLANVKVAAFDLRLRAFQRLVHPRVHNRLAFLHAERGQDFFQTLGTENPHQIVFEAQEE